jgi:prophage DNA circulation protein
MIPPHNDSIWPDDTKRAAVILALTATTNSDMQFNDVIDAIKEALNSGRPLQFVMELIRLLTAGLGEQFSNSDTAAAYRRLAAQCQAAQDDMRSRGEWRNDHPTTHESG